MAKAYDVFISYSRRDQAFVRMLVERLMQSGVSVFYDEADIAIGQSLADSLHRAVQNAKICARCYVSRLFYLAVGEARA